MIVARDWLKKIREENGLTQAEVAKQLGIVQPSYQAIESGKTIYPNAKTAIQLGKLLGFRWTRLYEETEDPDDEVEG